MEEKNNVLNNSSEIKKPITSIDDVPSELMLDLYDEVGSAVDGYASALKASLNMLDKLLNYGVDSEVAFSIVGIIVKRCGDKAEELVGSLKKRAKELTEKKSEEHDEGSN